ncbi:MAG: DUF4215 domain-containing protein [Nannocystis sp.]|nr:DUF4215 domain-containing protein [Nannocystis sp.]MBA3547828.1 DUF4215 domain-containing protein [Nannocystis sp.]
MLNDPRRLGVLLVLLGSACVDPPVAPGTTSSTGETTAASSTSADTSAAASSTGESASEAAETSQSEASQGEADTSGTGSTAVDMPICGDGVLDPGEQCDLGFGLNADDGTCLSACVLATCGDGYVRAGLEECDDQNFVPGDGCHECGRTRIVFVTSDSYQPGQFMGLVGADQRCRSLAQQAGLKNFATFKAWMSDSKTSAKDRMVHGRGRYELVNGLLVADDWEALVAGELQNPINVTEKSETQETGVWTGTNPDGSAAEGANHCLDWTYNGGQHAVHWGVSSETSPSWTMAATDTNPTSCGGEQPIYCFEQM